MNFFFLFLLEICFAKKLLSFELNFVVFLLFFLIVNYFIYCSLLKEFHNQKLLEDFQIALKKKEAFKSVSFLLSLTISIILLDDLCHLFFYRIITPLILHIVESLLWSDTDVSIHDFKLILNIDIS